MTVLLLYLYFSSLSNSLFFLVPLSSLPLPSLCFSSLFSDHFLSSFFVWFSLWLDINVTIIARRKFLLIYFMFKILKLNCSLVSVVINSQSWGIKAGFCLLLRLLLIEYTFCIFGPKAIKNKMKESYLLTDSTFDIISSFRVFMISFHVDSFLNKAITITYSNVMKVVYNVAITWASLVKHNLE